MNPTQPTDGTWFRLTAEPDPANFKTHSLEVLSPADGSRSMSYLGPIPPYTNCVARWVPLAPGPNADDDGDEAAFRALMSSPGPVITLKEIYLAGCRHGRQTEREWWAKKANDIDFVLPLACYSKEAVVKHDASARAMRVRAKEPVE